MGGFLADSNGWQRVVSFFRRQSIAMVTTVCVGVITAAALWYPKIGIPDGQPVPSGELTASHLVQQSLPPSVLSPSASPESSASPALYVPPLTNLQVIHPFDVQTMMYSCSTGIWRVHDAVTLAGRPGEAVLAIARGTVQSCTEGPDGSLCIVLNHGDGLIAEYAGLAETALSAGIILQAGDVLGYLDSRPTPPPTLCLRLTHDGIPLDPLSLWGSG